MYHVQLVELESATREAEERREAKLRDARRNEARQRRQSEKTIADAGLCHADCF